MTAPTGDDALREELTEALDASMNPNENATGWMARHLADALLPVVLRYGRERYDNGVADGRDSVGRWHQGRCETPSALCLLDCAELPKPGRPTDDILPYLPNDGRTLLIPGRVAVELAENGGVIVIEHHDVRIRRLGSPAPADGGTYAHRCGTCAAIPRWQILREGDAVVTWACGQHLPDQLSSLQRDRATRLIVTRFPRQQEPETAAQPPEKLLWGCTCPVGPSVTRPWGHWRRCPVYIDREATDAPTV